MNAIIAAAIAGRSRRSRPSTSIRNIRPWVRPLAPRWCEPAAAEQPRAQARAQPQQRQRAQRRARVDHAGQRAEHQQRERVGGQVLERAVQQRRRRAGRAAARTTTAAPSTAATSKCALRAEHRHQHQHEREAGVERAQPAAAVGGALGRGVGRGFGGGQVHAMDLATDAAVARPGLCRVPPPDADLRGSGQGRAGCACGIRCSGLPASAFQGASPPQRLFQAAARAASHPA